MALQGDALADLIITTLKELGRGNFNEIVTNYQEYVGFRDVVNAKTKAVEGGYAVQRNLMVGTSGNARWTGLYATESTAVTDVHKTISVPHRVAKTSYALDELEITMNSGQASRIVDLLISRRAAAMIDLAELVEQGIWDVPPSSSDTEKPHGFLYYLVYNASAGFNGGHPTGFSDVAGLSSTSYPKWKNYTANYSAFSEDDLLDKWRTAFDLCHFMPPTNIPEYGVGMDWKWYTTQATKNEAVKFMRSQNDNLGIELATFNGTQFPTFQGVPIQWVPSFNDTNIIASGSEPIFGVNWRTFEVLSLPGWNMREQAPIRMQTQPTVRVVYVHTTVNMLCNNRRKNCLIAKSDPSA